jgi:hypothetical protein
MGQTPGRDPYWDIDIQMQPRKQKKKDTKKE